MKVIGRKDMVGLCCAAVFLALAPGPAFGQGGDDILGLWNNEEKTSRIEIVRCGDEYCGDIVWLKNPDYPPDTKDGVPGTPRSDHNNPSPGLRGKPLLGLRIMDGFRHADGSWSGGTIYDPKNGKTYRGKLTLGSPTRLNLRGFVGIPLFGRTSHWTREGP